MDDKSLTILLTTPEDDERPVYIAGNFNDWQVMDQDFRMKRLQKGKYVFQFALDAQLPEKLQFKFTKGDWNAVEIAPTGERTPNRITNQSTGILKETVYKWCQNRLPLEQEIRPVIELVSDHFEMPQLHRTRKIWALLPHDYYHCSRHYPVLYLQDAQNLFNDHAPFGSWEIDKKLAEMTGDHIGNLIVIAIEHAEEDRIKEYVVGHTSLGRGQGKAYMDFLTDTLMPFISSHYRTLPGREHTGIGGSSLGALISLFTGLHRPHCFGKLMIFSPSVWIAPHLHIPYSWLAAEESPTRVYLYAGGKESHRMLPDIQSLKNRMMQTQIFLLGKLQIHTSITPQGTHQEKYWSSEFPKAIEWLFFPGKKD